MGHDNVMAYLDGITRFINATFQFGHFKKKDINVREDV